MKLLIGLLFFAGIMVAGSEGDWWPWANIAGVAVTAAACWCARGMAD